MPRIIQTLDQQPPQAALTTWRLDQDLLCPGCDYNLRGLHGPVLDCPECGERVDVVQLATRRWDKPWYRAPGYNFLALPAACALVCGVVILILTVVVDQSRYAASGALDAQWLYIYLAAWLGSLVAWAGLLWLAYLRFGRDFKAVGFALLCHVALAGYVLGIAMIVGGGMQAASILLWGSSGSRWFLLGIAITLLGLGLMIGGRYAERSAAKYCIRKWIKRGTQARRKVR